MTASASCLASACSDRTRCRAMRSAERGPMPGRRVSAATSDVMGSGMATAATEISAKSRQIKSRGDFAHFLGRNFLRLRQRLVGGGENHVLENLRVRGIQRLRIDLHRADGAIAFCDDFHGAAAAGGLDG